jgi:CysZ protein
MTELLRGAGLLLRGFGWWARRPAAMALGLIPAVVVAVALVAALVALASFLPGVAQWLTPFAEGWPEFWTGVLRIGVSLALLGGAGIIALVSFTALTLLVGEPFYDRIWRTVERSASGDVPDAPYGFWRSAGDALSLVGRGILVALLAGAIGLIPLVGTVIGAIVGTILTGWVLADELTSRALTARGITRRERRRLLRGARARVLGFGVATQLCFLVPLGAIAVMPAATAGSTMLARTLVGEEASG